MNKKAFSLSEVLIVIAVLGVVAAVSMPVLMNYLGGVHIRRAQKTYATVTRIIRGAEANAGVFSQWPDNLVKNEEFFKNYIEPQFQFEKVFVKSTGGGSIADCKANAEFAPTCGFFSFYQNLLIRAYLLRDGSVIAFVSSAGPNVTFILFDTNGAAEPNMTGVDVFLMTLANNQPDASNANRGVHPYGLNPAGMWYNDGDLRRFCIKWNDIGMFSYIPQGSTCLAILVKNGFKATGYPITSWGK